MAVIDTANKIADGIVTAAKATVVVIVSTLVATVDFLKNLPERFPNLVRNIGLFFRAGINLGKAFFLFLYDAAVYLLKNFPTVLRALYDVAAYVLGNIPEVLGFVKDMMVAIIKGSWSLCKFLYKNAFEITKAIIQNIPNILAHTLGVVLGTVYAGFIITGKILNALVEIIFPKSSVAYSLAGKQMTEDFKGVEHTISSDDALSFNRSFSPLYSAQSSLQKEQSAIELDNLGLMASNIDRTSNNRLR